MSEAIALLVAWAAREAGGWWVRRKGRERLAQALEELNVEAARLQMKLAELEARRRGR